MVQLANHSKNRFHNVNISCLIPNNFLIDSGPRVIPKTVLELACKFMKESKRASWFLRVGLCCLNLLKGPSHPWPSAAGGANYQSANCFLITQTPLKLQNPFTFSPAKLQPRINSAGEMVALIQQLEQR